MALIVGACADRPSLTAPTVDGSSASAAVAPGSAGVLILGSTVWGGASSKEATTAAALGFAVTVVTDAQWAAMTAADFSSYRAIILGDPNCRVGTAPVAAAAGNRLVWGPVVNGNVFIFGSDPVLHSRNLVTEKGVAFATAAAGKTGAYITTSCYYHGTAPGTAVGFLDGLSSLGSFTATGVPGCYNNAYKVANHPALDGLTSAYLSGWGCSVHNAFDRWPSDFEVLAIARSGNLYTAPDGTVGTPYVLARGEGLTVVSDIQLTPATATVAVGTTQTLTATVLSNETPVANTTVTFTIEDGLNAGTTGSAQTNASGVATFDVTSTTPGTSGVRARFTDALGRAQTSGRASVTWEIPADLTPPSITADITGTLGAADWYTSDVNITWIVTDNDTPITSTSGCAPASVTTDGAGFSFTCTATSTGGTATQTVTIKRDATAPVVTPSVTGTLGANGWYTSDVGVSFSAVDATSGIPADHDDHHAGGIESQCHANTVSVDTPGATFTCTFTNGAGLSTTQSVTVKKDATGPMVVYTGNAGTYAVDQQVSIACTATDAMSGVASSTCAPISGAAYAFALGPNSYTASAVDHAGNRGNGATTFNVVVTSASLCGLARQFVAHEGTQNSLCVKLKAAQAARDRGGNNTGEGSLGAFISEIEALAGKRLTSANAAILIALARAW
ncbi:MAG TPA: hypothetical protein VFO55_05610 [Gemmatimonadaceae bacterium]|nr:hypothetical protein [Gemmatimonadaceae bacterium]